VSAAAPGTRSRPTVAVVGGGIAGLAAAWELVAGAAGPGGDGPVPGVVVFEADDRFGGKLRAETIGDRRVDVAADAFLARRPEATGLCDELGLTDELVPMGASGASIWARHRLRPMPDGLNLGVPTRWWPLARSGILGPTESARVLKDLVVPHFGTGQGFGDQTVGEIVGGRLGRPVVERMADPLIGGINAGSVDRLSAAATFPVLMAASHQSGSLMRRLGVALAAAARSGPGPGTPVFWSLADSTASLIDALTGALTARGVTFRAATPVEAVDRRTGSPEGRTRWALSLGSPGSAPGHPDRPDHPDRPEFDGVILATPAPRAAVLLAPHAPSAAGLLSGIGYASVAVVTLSLPEGSVGAPLRGTGFLVPRTSTLDGRPALITGCTYLGRKWPHLARPGQELIRASVGRFGDDRFASLDDDGLIAAVLGELGALLDVRGQPLDAVVTRWNGAFPQYEVGHLIRVGRIEEDVAGLPGLAVAGAALRGVGIPACIGSGRAAARRVLASLALPSDAGSAPTGHAPGP
jgi:oxygen-dependent protoporphyrinogen oxidase